MGLYSSPPHWRPYRHDKPSLLVCWWATAMCTIIIFFRVAGRFIRTERLFREDKIAALALIPLYLRMGVVHYILVHDTNNTDFSGVSFSLEAYHTVQIASGLVLAARFFYAATLWVLKYAILEFFERLLGAVWARSYRISLIAVRWILVATFAAVVISDFVECRPFTNYWQVFPDPGGACRQGFIQLIVMASCNILTDLLLVFFPIPIILASNFRKKRKLQLTLLFSLSLSVVVVTAYRVPKVFEAHGRQQTRSLLASVELMFATAAANALVLGSFVRDRGVKKQKFRRDSAADSLDRTNSNPRRPDLQRQWGSDEDLVRDMGISLQPELRRAQTEAEQDRQRPTQAPPVHSPQAESLGDAMRNWQFPQRPRDPSGRSDDSLIHHELGPDADVLTSQRTLSLFDVGGLLEAGAGSGSSYRGQSSGSYTNEHHEQKRLAENHTSPSSTVTAASGGFRRGSQTLLQDLGGFLGSSGRVNRSRSRLGTELQTIQQSRHENEIEPSQHTHEPRDRNGRSEPVLRDPGGLLE